MIDKICNEINNQLKNLILFNGEINKNYNQNLNLKNNKFGTPFGIPADEIKIFEEETFKRYNKLETESSKALMRLLINDSIIELFIEDCSKDYFSLINNINKRADLIVGFINKNQLDTVQIHINMIENSHFFDIYTKKSNINTLTLEPNQFEFVLPTTFLPLYGIYKSEIYLDITNKDISNLYIIYGVINSNNKLEFAQTMFIYPILSDKIFYTDWGIARIISKDNKLDYEDFSIFYLIPDLEFWYLNYQKKRIFIKQIERDLIKKSYHPSRLYDWILDDIEKKEL
jgi:hypothetical protein